MSANHINNIQRTFEQYFDMPPALLVRAPGRINLIGEHTDYNNGFVLPAAVSQSIYFAIGQSNEDDQCSLISLDFNEAFNFTISGLKQHPDGSWQNYILGVIAEILKSGRQVKGFNMVFGGDIPQGSGMSSSAALECGTCFGLNELFELNLSRPEMARLSQLAEHNYVGVRCGIMDQFASMMGKKDHALKLDCQSLDFEYSPVALTDISIVLCNSNVEHSLASSEYNVRRQQCEEGVAILQKSFPNVRSLRDVSMPQLTKVCLEMPEVIFRRCKYVIEENERVKEFSIALASNDWTKAGMILKAAQKGMESEYEITCPEIDFMTDFANSRRDIVGSRMMGGGFGGCTLTLIRNGFKGIFLGELNQAYRTKFNKEITPIPVNISNGVSRIE